MGFNNLNNQSIQIPTGVNGIKDIPYTQKNEVIVDSSFGVVCFISFIVFIFVLYKKCEQHYLNWFEHKRSMDELELELKYGKR